MIYFFYRFTVAPYLPPSHFADALFNRIKLRQRPLWRTMGGAPTRGKLASPEIPRAPEWQALLPMPPQKITPLSENEKNRFNWSLNLLNQVSVCLPLEERYRWNNGTQDTLKRLSLSTSKRRMFAKQKDNPKIKGVWQTRHWRDPKRNTCGINTELHHL